MDAIEKYKIQEKQKRDSEDKLLAKKERLKSSTESISRKSNSVMIIVSRKFF